MTFALSIMATKKWYLREKNSSRYCEGEWIYFVENRIWVDDIYRANTWKTKKAATAFREEIGRGEVYGE